MYCKVDGSGGEGDKPEGGGSQIVHVLHKFLHIVLMCNHLRFLNCL